MTVKYKVRRVAGNDVVTAARQCSAEAQQNNLLPTHGCLHGPRSNTRHMQADELRAALRFFVAPCSALFRPAPPRPTRPRLNPLQREQRVSQGQLNIVTSLKSSPPHARGSSRRVWVTCGLIKVPVTSVGMLQHLHEVLSRSTEA
ncbi:hypothetical protein E2C01_027444 [Portunus trituberculatus]|uniref:Uncharacterized protein n=1 Tax=Portunus trituberculatus TaxID=210409 RepID=A0A5B7EHW3_PORTR|nr:hypothetical protein [Portunus trituberculatus]